MKFRLTFTSPKKEIFLSAIEVVWKHEYLFEYGKIYLNELRVKQSFLSTYLAPRTSFTPLRLSKTKGCWDAERILFEI